MKTIMKKFLALFCVAALALPVFAACGGGGKTPEEPPVPPVSDMVDYVEQLKLDMTSDTAKQEVKVSFYIDGDTTHFTPLSNASDFLDGMIKARYLAVNTPESTGKIEKWGKTASNFTHDTLAKAESIIVESDDGNWNFDSTGERYLLWIWYKPQGGTDYRNLNVELLQNGYGRSSKTSQNRYGETAQAALLQAERLELKIYGNETDPNFFSGAAENLTLKYLRFHIQDYVQHNVRVEGVITARYSSSVYIEQYDEETGVSFGIAVYYGYESGALLDILQVGNEVSVHGKVTEFNGTYQISDVQYYPTRPKDPTNTTLISEDNELPNTVVSVGDIVTAGARTVSASFSLGENEEGMEEYENLTIDYASAIMDTYVTIEDLTISDFWTTQKGASQGAMSVTVKDADGNEITVRTEVLQKDSKTLYTEDDFKADGKYKHIASVEGIVDYYSTDDAFQIAVWDFSLFTFAS